MIRSFISYLAGPVLSGRDGPFFWQKTDTERSSYPIYQEGITDNSWLQIESSDWPTNAEVYALLHEKCLGRRMQLGLAESCTGGMIASLITDHPGSSKYLYGGWVVYSNHAKFSWLQVSPHELEQQGAVSQVVINELLQGIFANSPCSHGIAVSGIAGPDGGTANKPVGTVWIGVAQREGRAIIREFRFNGNRQAVRDASAQVAALMLTELLWLMENNVDTLQKL